jgi:hypothetical protein
MRDQLLDILSSAGKPAGLLSLSNGSQVVVLPHGGRVLGLFAPGDTRNFYWTNPALNETASARELFESGRWQNTGGDRTWLAPEMDFFFPKFPDLSVYHQPREFDPGDYRVEMRSDSCRLATEFSIRLSRHPEPVALRLTKTIESVADPLRHEAWRPAGAAFAGYNLRTTLEFSAEPPPAVPLGLWHLIQMPHGGEMILPTYSPVQATTIFGDIPPDDLRTTPPGIRYRMRAIGEQKIGLRAVDCPGRIGYFHETGDVCQLVMRNFFVNPSGEYVDAPWTNPADLGYAVQVCNVNSHLGQFSELEYHIPAIGVPDAPRKCEDIAQVWAWRGPREELAPISQRLLGAEL